jgi:dihydrofolate reductase
MDVNNRRVLYGQRGRSAGRALNSLPGSADEKVRRSKMRKVTFGGANSLDNYFARKDDAVDWLLWSKEAARYMTEYWKTIDTVIMGRKTYEVAARGGGSPAYGGVKTYVCSRTMTASPAKGVELVREDAAAFVRELKRQKGKDICVMGGGLLAKALFEADLIDEIGFNIHPVLLGSGIPLFHEMKRQINLELLECQPFKNGCVLVTYRVKHRRGVEKA